MNDQKTIKKKWYLKNKEFLREFERTAIFKMYRNQRTRVFRLKKELAHEEGIMKRFFNQMQRAKADFQGKMNDLVIRKS